MNSIELLARLLAFDTVSRNPNRALIDDVAGLLRGAGLDPVLIPDASGTKANLLVTVGPRDRAGVLVSGHTDVVPVDGQAWSVPPRDEQPSLHSWLASAKWARSCEPGRSQTSLGCASTHSPVLRSIVALVLGAK